MNDKYYKLIEEQSKLSDLRAEQKKDYVLKENMRKWMYRVTEEFASIKLSDLEKEHIDKLIGLKDKPIDVLVGSKDRNESLRVGYAIVNYCIKQGYFGPSDVKITSLSSALDNIHGAFEAKEWKTNFFDNNAKMFLIHGCNKRKAELAKKGDIPFWEEFLDFISHGNRNFIICYTLSSDEKIEDNGKIRMKLSHLPELNTEILKYRTQIFSYDSLFKPKAN